MPLTGEAKRTYQREYMRRQRAADRTADAATLPAAPVPVAGLGWFAACFPGVLDWVRGVLAPGVLYGASTPRANGKTSWAGCTAAATVAPDGPLRVGTVAVAVAASFGHKLGSCSRRRRKPCNPTLRPPRPIGGRSIASGY